MLITQRHSAANIDMVAWLSGFGSVVGATASDLVFQNSDGTFSHLIGTGISYDAFSNTWSGTVTHIQRAMLGTPGAGLAAAVTTEILFSTPVTVSVLSAGSTGVFVGQLMNVAGNTNAGLGVWGNETLAGSNQADNLDGAQGRDVVDYTFATVVVAVDLSGTYANTGAAAGDTLAGIEGVRGTVGADTLRGSSAANLLDGGAGNDLIYADGGGLDLLSGGAGWDRLDMTGLAGDLTVSGGSVGSSQISGFESFVTGNGHDRIYGQLGDAEYITGGGNDQVTLSGSGNNTVLTGAGNDVISVFGAANLALDMGADTDNLTFILSSGLVTTVTMTDVGTGSLSGVMTGTFSGVEVLTSYNMRIDYRGHAGRDEVYGSLADDSIFGAAGDDLIDAGNGNDLLYGDSDWWVQGGSLDYGSDRVLAGGGNDTMLAGQGWDTYSGGSGTDTLSYAKLFDDLGYGTYSITLNANGTITKAFQDWYGDIYTETDTIQTGAGDDIEVIIGTVMDDTFQNATTARTFEGGWGADLYAISLANGGDVVRGFADGADLIRVSAGAVATVALAGNWVASGASYTHGTLTFEAAGFDLNAAGLGGTAGVTLRNSAVGNGATMTGTAFADRFETWGSADVIEGGEGDDTYVCLGGNIGLIFDSGTSLGDHLILDASVYLGMSIEHVTLVGAAISANGNAAANRMIGNDLGNTFVGAGGADTMQGGLGSDTYHYTGSETLIEAGYFVPYYDFDLGWVIDPDRDRIITRVSMVMTDTGFEDLTLGTGAVNATGNLQGNQMTGNAVANSLRGMAGEDVIWGGAGHDVLSGGGDNDRLRGDTGNDTLRGELGDDSLLGSDGADQLLGGTGVNRLTGGRGADQFIFGQQAEVSIVTDFTDGVDTLVFSSARGLTEAYLLSHAVQVGSSVVLTTTVIGTEITVANTTIAALSGDILIV